MVDQDSILLIWTTAMLAVLYKTNSLRSSISTTAMVVTMFIASFMHIVVGGMCDLFFMATILTILVARVIPVKCIDKWRKNLRAN